MGAWSPRPPSGPQETTPVADPSVHLHLSPFQVWGSRGMETDDEDLNRTSPRLHFLYQKSDGGFRGCSLDTIAINLTRQARRPYRGDVWSRSHFRSPRGCRMAEAIASFPDGINPDHCTKPRIFHKVLHRRYSHLYPQRMRRFSHAPRLTIGRGSPAGAVRKFHC